MLLEGLVRGVEVTFRKTDIRKPNIIQMLCLEIDKLYREIENLMKENGRKAENEMRRFRRTDNQLSLGTHCRNENLYPCRGTNTTNKFSVWYLQHREAINN